jgi:L,D-transpeptidase ErfK/SrfK
LLQQQKEVALLNSSFLQRYLNGQWRDQAGRSAKCAGFLVNSRRLLAVLATISILNACAVTRSAEEKPRLTSGIEDKEIQCNQFKIAKGNDLIGQLAFLRLEKGDTLPDIARHFSLGVNAITAANPGVDVWVPNSGKQIILPLSFILPETPRRGIVVNLAAMRLFRFKGAGNYLEVSTYPIGIGMKDRPTPTGQMRVERKAARPTWYVPASISEDHKKKGDPLPSEVPPGPLNPLGEWALYLSKSGYLIHGTNKPASIGLEASNGCIRLYPENV